MFVMLKPTKEKDFHFHVCLAQKVLPSTISEGYGIGFNKLSSEETAKLMRG
jgi:hypothetical protein